MRDTFLILGTLYLEVAFIAAIIFAWKWVRDVRAELESNRVRAVEEQRQRTEARTAREQEYMDSLIANYYPPIHPKGHPTFRSECSLEEL